MVIMYFSTLRTLIWFSTVFWDYCFLFSSPVKDQRSINVVLKNDIIVFLEKSVKVLHNKSALLDHLFSVFTVTAPMRKRR